MSAFSIFAHDSDPTEDSILDPPAPAVLSYQRRSSDKPQGEIAESNQSSPSGGLEEDPLPDVVLRLPDLTTLQPASPDQQPRLASWLYWVGIALGALLALSLIWTPSATAPPRDEAPAWTAGPQIDNSAPLPNAPSAVGGDRASDAPAPPGHFDGPGAGSRPGVAPGVQEPPAQQPAIPQWNDAATRRDPSGRDVPPAAPGWGGAAQPPAEVRTARGGETRWYGSPVGVKPSEAAPLGISTPEPR